MRVRAFFGRSFPSSKLETRGKQRGSSSIGEPELLADHLAQGVRFLGDVARGLFARWRDCGTRRAVFRGGAARTPPAPALG